MGRMEIHSRFCSWNVCLDINQPPYLIHSLSINRGPSSTMNSSAKRIILLVVAILFTIGLTLARNIDSPDSEGYQKNQGEQLSYQELPLDNALFKYILAKEILSRQKSYDIEERERKRNYWKQCAFNAVSCFGKK